MIPNKNVSKLTKLDEQLVDADVVPVVIVVRVPKM
jgi:hypothetical protein